MIRSLARPRHRATLPQLDGGLFLTDGGLETTLSFLDGSDLPHFAAFDLFRRSGGEDRLERYFHEYAAIARAHGTGLVLESPTWRASRDWGRRLGYSDARLAAVNRRSIQQLERVRTALGGTVEPVVISGCVGPRGDGYDASRRLSVDEAADYHRAQIDTFARSAADLVTAMTMTHVEEAIGVVRSARAAGMPVVISFTTETDGRLPSGQSLRMAIEQTDAVTDAYPAYYMVNCAHPSHFEDALREDAAWTRRVRGLRANASCLSHAELDSSPTLDIGDPHDLGRRYAELRSRMPWLTVLGGCCGTDARHLERIAAACAPLRRAG